MNESTYNTLREAGHKPQIEIDELIAMLRGLTPAQCTRSMIDDLHAKACEVKNGLGDLADAIITEAEK